MAKSKESAKRTTAKLEKLAEQVVQQVKGGDSPNVAVPSRSLSNVHFNKKKNIIELGEDTQKRLFFNVAQAKKFMQTFLVGAECKKLIASGKTTSIRDLYYMTKHTLGRSSENTFEDQKESDPIIEDLEVTVDALREELHLFASNRGSLVGQITLVDSGDTIDGRRMGSGGWAVPSIVEPEVIQFKKCDAKFVLIMEKDAVFRRLNEDRFWQKNPCILLQSNGQPARGMRRLLKRLHDELKLPIYVLVDNDPWGFYIYSVIRMGSINLAFESMRMAVPQARFIGLSAFDREKYKLPQNMTIKLTDDDRKRAKQMMAYPWFEKKEWRREIDHMTNSGIKMEIQALSSKGISFISEEYLPQKLRDRDWLE